MHRPAAEILPFLLVRLPIIAIESSLVVSPTSGAASTVMPLLDIKSTGIADVPIREYLHPVGECSSAVVVGNCRCPMLHSALRLIGVMLSWRPES